MFSSLMKIVSFIEDIPGIKKESRSVPAHILEFCN